MGKRHVNLNVTLKQISKRVSAAKITKTIILTIGNVSKILLSEDFRYYVLRAYTY